MESIRDKDEKHIAVFYKVRQMERNSGGRKNPAHCRPASPLLRERANTVLDIGERLGMHSLLINYLIY